MIKIKEEIKIGNVILEKGDRIEVLKESTDNPFISLLQKAISQKELYPKSINIIKWDENTYSSFTKYFTMRSSNDIRFSFEVSHRGESSYYDGSANIMIITTWDDRLGRAVSETKVAGFINDLGDFKLG